MMREDNYKPKEADKDTATIVDTGGGPMSVVMFIQAGILSGEI
jgi:hypothetical protein